MSDPYKLVPVLDGKGLRVPNLYTRAGVPYMQATVRGKRFLRSVPDGCTTLAARRKWIADFRLAAEDGRIEALEESKARRTVPTIKKVCEVYEAAAARRGRPIESVAERNTQALRKVLRDAGCTDPDKASVLELSAKVLAGFAGAHIRPGMAKEDADRARRTVASYLNQARSVFAAEMMQEYRGLGLEGLAGLEAFRHDFVCEAPAVRRVPYTDAEVAILRSGADLEQPAHASWFLGYYLALRLGETKQARIDMLRRFVPTADMRERFGWLREREFVWVFDLGASPSVRLKNAASAGLLPVADDVAAALMAMAAEDGWIVPAATETARENAGKRLLRAHFRELGWERRKSHHELRAYRQQVWLDRCGEDVRRAWARHARPGVSAAYTHDLVLSKAPLGLGE